MRGIGDLPRIVSEDCKLLCRFISELKFQANVSLGFSHERGNDGADRAGVLNKVHGDSVTTGLIRRISTGILLDEIQRDDRPIAFATFTSTGCEIVIFYTF